MRTLFHISDIHFGRVDYTVVKPLITAVHKAAPDVVVISGDLTQRARPKQFAEARDFLAQLPAPQIIVPGNHDVPLYNLLNRFLRPLRNYRRYITDDLEPFYLDDEIAVLGINTARSLTFKDGRISREQIGRIRDRLCAIDKRIVKILVTHHPLDLPCGIRNKEPVGRAESAMAALASCGADLLLAGHYHVGAIGDTARRYPLDGYAALVIHAGTALSTRGRGTPNSFNIISIDPPNLTVDRLAWNSGSGEFALSVREKFIKTANGWNQGEDYPSTLE